MSTTIAVIGGGIAGVTTAFHLARRGAVVTLIDDGGFGQATGASAGIIAPWVSKSEGAFYDAYESGGNYYPEFLSQLTALGIPELGYRKAGALVVDANAESIEAEYDRIAERVARAGAVAGEVRRVASGAVKELFPALADGLTGLLVTGGGRVDGRILCDASMTGAIAHGATRIADVVTGLEQTATGWSVKTTRKTMTFDAVVVAAGARVLDIFDRLDMPIGVSPQRGQIVHLHLQGVNTSLWPTIHPLGDHYMTPFDGGRIAVGATRETGSGFDPRVTAAGELSVLQKALELAPGLGDATLLETRVGIRPMADGQMPIVGPVPGRDGLWVASGYGAGGLTMGPLLGDAIARDVMGESAPELAPFAMPAPA